MCWPEVIIQCSIVPLISDLIFDLQRGISLHGLVETLPPAGGESESEVTIQGLREAGQHHQPVREQSHKHGQNTQDQPGHLHGAWESENRRTDSEGAAGGQWALSAPTLLPLFAPLTGLFSFCLIHWRVATLASVSAQTSLLYYFTDSDWQDPAWL